jgi:hypothetical protein
VSPTLGYLIAHKGHPTTGFGRRQATQFILVDSFRDYVEDPLADYQVRPVGWSQKTIVREDMYLFAFTWVPIISNTYHPVTLPLTSLPE